jgi:predicted DNA-binding protein YlxM (UPF0122 family)
MGSNRKRRILSVEPEAEEDLRGRTELLRCRIGLLRGEDRLLMEMYVNKGAKCGQIARLTRVSEVTITRRIRKLERRLLDGEYITCLRNREQFSTAQMRIARDYFLTGMSMREIEEKHDTTYYAIHQTMSKIRRLVDVGRRS